LGAPDKKTPAPEPLEKRPAAGEFIPLAVALVAFFILAGCYISRAGLAWDEALYIPYAETYRLWFAGLPATFNWADFYNSLGRFTSHPPLATYQMAVTMQAFANSMSRLYAARVASVLSMAMLLAAVYFFTLRTRSVLAALATMLFLMLMPNVFAFSILATLDMPMMLWWFAAAALFYAAMDNRKLAWLAGLAAALAFLTKINALALPLVLWPWGLYFHGRKALPAIVWSVVLVPVVFFAFWPFLWAQPLLALGKYFGEKFAFVVSAYAAMGIDLNVAGDVAHRMIRRTDVTALYFGRVYTSVPWHYSFVMLAITTPLSVFAAAAAGLASFRRANGTLRLLVFLAVNILFWLLAFAVGLVRAYDGVRLFSVIFPFIAVLAGIGVDFLWQCLSKSLAGKMTAALATGLLLLCMCCAFFEYEPFGLSHYNLLVGGLPGAVQEGLPVTYWGETVSDPITNYVNSTAPELAAVAAFPMDTLYVENMRWFGLIRGDLQYVAVSDDWDYLIIANRGDALAEREDIRALTDSAVVTTYVRGVPAAWLVEKKR